MRPWISSTENDLRHVLNEWDPLGVADDVQDEYDCMLAPLLQRLQAGADQTEIGGFLRHELEDHFGLDALGLRPEAMAARVLAWWGSAARPTSHPGPGQSSESREQGPPDPTSTPDGPASEAPPPS